MAAKLQCYHTWLFYYLYSADFKLLKAIFKLKFSFAKILFAHDFAVLFCFKPDTEQKIKDRKWQNLSMLKNIYFSQDYNSQTEQRFYNNRAGMGRGSRDRAFGQQY